MRIKKKKIQYFILALSGAEFWARIFLANLPSNTYDKCTVKVRVTVRAMYYLSFLLLIYPYGCAAAAIMFHSHVTNMLHTLRIGES